MREPKEELKMCVDPKLELAMALATATGVGDGYWCWLSGGGVGPAL